MASLSLIANSVALALLFLLGSPVTQASAPSQRGQEIFKLCATCHGNQGEGNQSLAAPAIAGLPQWYLLTQLKNFRSGARGKHPQDAPGLRMGPMARTLKEGDLETIAAFVSQLAPHKLAPISTGTPQRGEEHFQVCIGCHGHDARGEAQLNAPPLRFSNDWYLISQLKNFRSGLRGANGALDPQGASMSAMAQMLPDEEAIRDVVTYISNLKDER